MKKKEDIGTPATLLASSTGSSALHLITCMAASVRRHFWHSTRRELARWVDEQVVGRQGNEECECLMARRSDA